MKKKFEYEVIDIAPKNPVIQASDYEFIESEWAIVINGMNKTAQEVNRKTGESRPYDYEKAMSELFE